MDAIVAALISFFLIDPLQTGIAKALAVAGMPEAISQQVTTCAKAAAPAIVKRATDEPAWLVSTALSVWMGSRRLDAILVEAAPNCAAPVAAARGYFDRRS